MQVRHLLPTAARARPQPSARLRSPQPVMGRAAGHQHQQEQEEVNNLPGLDATTDDAGTVGVDPLGGAHHRQGDRQATLMLGWWCSGGGPTWPTCRARNQPKSILSLRPVITQGAGVQGVRWGVRWTGGQVDRWDMWSGGQVVR